KCIWRSSGIPRCFATNLLSVCPLFPIGILVIILIGLMVTWLGYVKNARWVLFGQFVIAVWAFCLFVLPIAGPILRGQMTVSVAEWAYIAIHQSGLLRSYAEPSLIFWADDLGVDSASKVGLLASVVAARIKTTTSQNRLCCGSAGGRYGLLFVD